MKPWILGIISAGLAMIMMGCSSPPPPAWRDADLERDVAVARGAYAAGAVDKAAVFYRQAYRRACLADDAASIGRQAYNLAACLAAQGQYAEARKLLDEARLEFQQAGLDAPEVLLLEARLARWQGQPERAVALAQGWLQCPPRKGQELYRLQFRLLLAELACERGEAGTAARELSQIDPRRIAPADWLLRADLARTRARWFILDQKSLEAVQAFDEAAADLQRAGRYREMADCLNAAGQAGEAAGKIPLALDRYYRAARSLFENDLAVQSREIVARARALAQKHGQVDWAQRLECLQHEIAAVDRTKAGGPGKASAP